MQMRSKVSKVLIFVLFALLILSFAVWGIGDIFQGPGQNTAVAQVEDIEINALDFQTDFNREMRRLQNRVGTRIGIEQARALGLIDQVLIQMVNRALYDQRANDLGMTVSEDRIKTQILNEPAFHDARGEFDQNRFLTSLRATNMSEQQFVNSLRGDLSRQQIAEAITGTAAAPDILAEAVYAYASEKRIAEYITVTWESIEDPAEPDETAIRSFYEENEANYMQPETRALSILHLRPEDLAKEITISDEDLALAFEERREELSQPERRAIEQMVFAEEELANQVKAEIEGGVAFADAGTELEGSGVIPLGTVTRSELEGQLPELGAAAFDVAQGEIGGPVQSTFGWHLVNVTEVTAGEEAVFEDEREELQQDLAMEIAIDGLIDMANQLDDQIAGGASLSEAANSLGVDLLQIPAMDEQGLDTDGMQITGLPDLNDLLPVLRDLEVGQESLLTETRDGGYFMAQVESTTPASAKPLDTVRVQVIADWRNEERRQQARAAADALEAEAKEGKALSALAERENRPLEVTEPVTRTGVSESFQVPRQLASQLFEIKPGEITVAQGPDGFLVAKLTAIEPVDPEAEAEGIDELRDRLGESLQGDILSQFSAALRQNYTVSVNQAVIDEVLSYSY